MPTTQVEPGSESLLQDIANSLWKSRKVVVITGAGISTNSGIPDFRSENGLYSLIQAQFAAAATKETSSSSGDADESDRSSDRSSDHGDERPAKRRRISSGRTETARSIHQKEQAPEQVSIQETLDEICVKCEQEGDASALEPGQSDIASEDASAPVRSVESDVMECTTSGIQHDVPILDLGGRAHSPAPPDEPPGDRPGNMSRESSPLALAELTPLPSPRFSPGRLEGAYTTPERVGLKRCADFASSPPSMALDALRLPSDPDAPRTMGSSPLSSPPPILFDPYRESSSSPSDSSSQESSPSRFESEDPSSASTPLLTSQSSYASSSSRTSLPNMKGKDLFDAQIWSCPVKTSVFYTFTTTLRQKVRTVAPTSSHQFVSILRDSRKLVRCYTQNIDQLEERVGLSTSLSLGAGSRYRFSARAGRSSGGRGLLKESTTSNLTQTQVSSQNEEGRPKDSEGQSESQLEGQSSLSQDATLPSAQVESQSRLDSVDSPAGLEASSQPADTATPDATQSTVPAPPAPNRGVECVFLHGSLAELRCFVCGRTSSWDDDSRQADTLAGRQPTCPHCAGATAAREERGKRALGVGKLRPDIVLYGEEHPHAHLISPIVQHDLSLGPDMLLILGTSMRVHGLKVLVKEFAKAVHDRGGKVVFVNFTKPPDSVWADVIDYWVQWDCDAWVGDLQKRKPALWLPPGTVLPEDEKVKPVKPSRRISGGEASKKKESTSAVSNKRRESGGQSRKARKEDTAPSAKSGVEDAIQCSDSPPEEMPPPSSVPKKKAPKMPREPKLNPDAKRPASIRDHRLNGAYLVWKIMHDLRRATGNDITPSADSSPPSVKTRSKARRTRRSAPAALGSQDSIVEEIEATATQPDEDGTVAQVDGEATPPSPMKDELMAEPKEEPERDAPKMITGSPSLLEREDEPVVAEHDVSISAVVKSRKRKRTVTWKMVQGVETLVSLDDDPKPENEKEPAPEPVLLPPPPPPPPLPSPPPPSLPHTSAVFKPPPLPLPRSRTLPKPTIPKAALPKTTLPKPTLPDPTPTKPAEAPPRTSTSPPIPNLTRPASKPGFYETDRLIAMLSGRHEEELKQAEEPLINPTIVPVPKLPDIATGFQETDRLIARYNELAASRPTTPVPVQLAPLQNIQQGGGRRAMGPTAAERPKLQPLEPKVMSPGPVAAISPNVGSPVAMRHSNPFFLADPMQGRLGYPPIWLERPMSSYDGEREGGHEGMGGGYWCPGEQLQKEQEAAMMLSVLRGGGGGGGMWQPSRGG
ncbi:hypothetical protein B0T17DRAFT_509127 [Bombardia bombarda]|uniref:Deacetylase sirtuin-type domain-containing protein n=1 Tax=Bombardia bombarda TaxID=252184 RepID=A0AA39WUJ1_9PEZI|nr:hypothetical protein B0T17DRAFT_509127 [Bombardia bombarda]